jgi:hypothetical protein
MIKKYFLLAFLPLILNAQTETEEYRSASNPLYWKNRKPNEAYWQQDVNYNIKAQLIDEGNVVIGEETLTYWNNSPDELPFVFFHLYSNAQTKGSYLADLYKNNGVHLKFGQYRAAGMGTNVENISVDGQPLKTEVDYTVMKVLLSTPLKPGESITFKIKFKTFFDNDVLIRNRMKLFGAFGYKHYNLVHWYPRISVYDAKQGWDTDQHMDHEFYGDFGSFHVELSLPNQYICDGTGVLQNEKDVLPAELRQKLDLANFAKKPWNSAPSEIIKPDGTFKVWKFDAINVHDAAYTFDPTYRIAEVVSANNVRCMALVQEQHAMYWQNAAKYVAKVIENNSKNIGPYAYPKMISADAEDGMEYPMITLNGGSDPGYRGLFIHEISHNWFFGMVGSNETYRAFMDEGFTQFYTCDGWEHIEGANNIYPKIKSAYVRNHTDTTLYRETNSYIRYVNDIVRGDETTLNTHSDYFNGALAHGGGYGQVYMKTTVMLYNLRYVLGNDLFTAAMQHYFNQWKFCHPYPEDFRKSMIQFTHVDLNWFFDEWLETAKTIDYSIKKVKQIGSSDQYRITFKRKGRMQMPLDFTVETTTREKYKFYIPNTWFEKKTNATILPRWIGWDKVRTSYTATVTIPSGQIKNVILDTAHIMPDVNPFNNAKPRNVSFIFDSKIANPPNRNKYQLYARPSLWYNGYDGVKAGVHISGNYLNYKNVFDFTFWLNTQLGQAYLDKTVSVNSHDPLSFLLNYKTATDKFMKKSGFYSTLKSLDGLASALFGFEKKSNNEKIRFYVQLKGMVRYNDNSLNYLIYKNEWSAVETLNSYASFGVDHNYTYYRGTGFMDLHVRAPFLGSYDFSSATFTAVNKTYFGKVGIHTRVFAQYGMGNNIPTESALYVAGANPEEMMDSKYTRAMGIFQPFNFGATTGNFAAGGGLNLRGYMGYLLPSVDAKGNYHYNYKGTSGASVNAELDFSKYFSFITRATKQNIAFGTYLFGDAGVINTNYVNQAFALSDVMIDAGIGTTLTIQKWGKLQTLKPLTIRADFPLFINRLPYAESNYFQFRWMIGVSRAF